MIRDGSGSASPVHPRVFASPFAPDASPREAALFDALRRADVSPENGLRARRMTAEADVTALARRVRVPPLALHCAGDRVAPIGEGRLMARLIPGASFVELPGGEALERLVDEAARFAAGLAA